MRPELKKRLNKYSWLCVGTGRVGVRVCGIWFYVSTRILRVKSRRDPGEEDKRAWMRRYRALRKKLWEKQQGGCKACGVMMEPDKMSIHHIRPWSVHPELALELSNLWGLCPRCHQLMHSIGADLKRVREEIVWIETHREE